MHDCSTNQMDYIAILITFTTTQQLSDNNVYFKARNKTFDTDG